MKLYWSHRTRSIRILWLLEESGLKYEAIHLDIRDAKAKADPAFRAVSPLGKVPGFEDGPVRLWDSGAIALYVGDQYPDSKLGIPVGNPKRGEYLQWVLFTNSCMEPAMGEKVGGLPANPSQSGWGSWDLMLDTLRKGVEAGGPFILGEQFTGADVLLGSGCNFMRVFGMLKDDPVLFAYADRCIARPAFQRAQAMEAAKL